MAGQVSANRSSGPAQARVVRGPIGIGIEVLVGGTLAITFAWIVGICIAYGGSFTSLLWAGQGVDHASNLVEENLAFIAEYPSSVFIADTVSFERTVIGTVARPFVALGVMKYYSESQKAPLLAPDHLAATTVLLKRELAKIFMIAMYVAMDTATRLFVVVFALPAFALACLLGIVDGLVRRDLRRWGGGRESSFVYHRAKKATAWSISGGFGIYLAWPFGGFNPAYMVLIFTVLVALSLSTYVSTFKKYL